MPLALDAISSPGYRMLSIGIPERSSARHRTAESAHDRATFWRLLRLKPAPTIQPPVLLRRHEAQLLPVLVRRQRGTSTNRSCASVSRERSV